MPISFVGSHVGTHAATSAQTVNFSSLLDSAGATPTLQQNDYVIVAVENSSTVNRTQAQLTPSGYTALHTDDYRDDSNDSNFLVSAKFMGATPDTSVAIPASDATTAGVGYAIIVLRGVNLTTQMDVAPVVTGGINGGIANPAAVTPTTAGSWIVVAAGAAVAAGAVFTNPGDLSATTNHFRSATITTTTNDANIGIGLKTNWTSGAFDPAAWGGSTSTNTGSWSAVTLAVREEPQSLTPSLFTNSQTFHAPTVSHGLTAALFTNSQTFHAAAVAPGAVTLAPPLSANSQTFPSASVANVVSPSLVTNSQAFYGPTVASGDNTLTPSLFTNSQAFHAATVAASSSIAPSLVSNSQTFHAATVAPGTVTLAPPVLTSSQAFPAPVVTRIDPQSLENFLYINLPVFFAPRVTRISIEPVSEPAGDVDAVPLPPAATIGVVLGPGIQIATIPLPPVAHIE